MVAGALERSPVFVEPLTLKAVLDLPHLDDVNPESGQEVQWVELCESFTDEPRLAELRSAAFRRLPAGHPLSRERATVDTRSITVEAPAGAAISLLPASAASLLPAIRTDRAERSETDANTRYVEITWTTPAPGRLPLPLRPPSSMSLDVLDACRTATHRPNPWCFIGFASRESANLLARLTESWGQGITFLTSKDQLDGDHGIPRGDASAIQQCSEMRVWWGDGEYLDPFLVLDALCHGCLPLQCVSEDQHDALVGRLPPGLAQFTLAIPKGRAVPNIATRSGRPTRRRAVHSPFR